MADSYTDLNASTVDSWVKEGWEWGKPVTHEQCADARRGQWSVVLTPVKPVPKDWFGDLKGKRVLGLASGGGQQMPLFALAGANCTVLDYSEMQLASEHAVAQREGYDIQIIRADMTKPLPFEDGSFDLIFHPVSNCYVEDVCAIWRECHRVLKVGGRLLCGLDNGLSYAYDDDTIKLTHRLPFNPLKDKALYDECVKGGCGIQFSHTIMEQIGGQLKAGFRLLDVYDDTDPTCELGKYNVPMFWATLAVKE